MAEINKLSVGQALDKLRRADAPQSRMERLDEKNDALDEEIQRLRQTRLRLERGHRHASSGLDSREINERRITKRMTWWSVGISIVTAIFAWWALGR
jgi:hypothetical protein